MKTLKDTVTTLLLCSAVAFFCYYSPQAKAGALDGIRMCEEIIIPSLLPILIICNILTSTRAKYVFEKLFGKAFRTLFRLPECTAAAVIFGLIGGYPTGAVLTSKLYKTGVIDEDTAARIMSFNFCGGAAFIISAVGTVNYGSAKIGLILFCCCCFSSIIIMLSGRLNNKRTQPTAGKHYGIDFSDALCEAVESTVKSLAVMSAYIIIFSSFCAVLNPPSALLPIFEITNGIFSADIPLPLPYCAFFLSFGGLCIHLQLFSFLKEMKIKYYEFLTYRMLCALISFFLMKAYIRLFPESIEVFSNISMPQHKFSSESMTISLLMIIGCAVVIFDIENRKLKLISSY